MCGVCSVYDCDISINNLPSYSILSGCVLGCILSGCVLLNIQLYPPWLCIERYMYSCAVLRVVYVCTYVYITVLHVCTYMQYVHYMHTCFVHIRTVNMTERLFYSTSLKS